jgi:hypothetical protein
MAETVRRIGLALTKENVKQLNALMNHLGESASVVLKRALLELHNKEIKLHN